MKDSKLDVKYLIGPILVWAAGLALVILWAPKTVYLNKMVMLGFCALCIGTFWFLYALCKAYDQSGKDWPFFLELFFPNYPVVEDQNELMRRLSRFRRSYSDYLSGSHEEQNSSLQYTASQLMWHSTALQKQRLLKKHLTIEMESVRRAYTDKKHCIRQHSYFDGRYQVNDIYEEISAVRTIRRNDQILKRIKDQEVAHYTLLSAKQMGGDQVICPNCGNTTGRQNLLDGCDYCGTRFTVEDMKNQVDSFGLRHDIKTNASKKEAVKELFAPWVTLATMLPLIYFGLIGAFVYLPGTNLFLRLATGLFTGALLGLLGWCIKSMVLTLTMPLLLIIGMTSRSMNRKLICSRKQEEEQERRMADQVRKTDPFFSIQSFFGGIQNKLSAIHYAETAPEINAFSEQDMASHLAKYQDVIDTDVRNITMESYDVDEQLQTAAVSAELRLLELRGNQIREREEKLKLKLIKDAHCKTQAVCGPSVLKCGGCGSSLSLMEGKTCRYCGRRLDYKRYDWEIAKYEIM